MNSEIELRDHVFAGPLRRSVNNASKVAGSIHDDATATKLGFRGGTVAGSIHLELFPPILLKAFGQRWFERGTISMYFLNATTDREAVRAFAKEPPAGATDAQVDIWIERDDGMRVAEGTASIGSPEEPTALLRRPLDRFDPGDLRILGGLKVGDQFEECDAFLSKGAMADRMKVITEPLEWYTKPSPWGASIATPATMVQLLYSQSIATLRSKLGRAVGLFGAIELRNINGPVMVEHPYRVSGSIVALGQSPKTEYMWFETALNEADGKRVAEMRMLLRFMKASSPKYKDATAN
ncbi:MAG TPA: hypothetical protein VIW95_14490 [Candidatus Binatus sp.]|jgi:hypothetical protein|uniref:hypothetical protein n=1 Tax=Candidatus Binatus sp. TaxID=2811406 RepID=UPI002F41E26E